MSRLSLAAAGIAVLLLAPAAAAQGKDPPPAKAPPLPVTVTPPAAPPAAPPKPAPKPAPRPKPTPHPDAPPPPPSPGLAPPPPAPPPGSLFSTDSTQAVLKEPPLAGWHGGFFLRDPGDYFRLYPRGRLHLDFNTWPGAPTGTAAEGGIALQPRFFVRRLRVEIAGQLLTRWTFLVGVEFGGLPPSNAIGKIEQSAAAPAVDPGAAAARYAPIEPLAGDASIFDAYINYSVCNCLNFTVGQFSTPFSMDNRTGANLSPFMERHLGTVFAVPTRKDLGLMIWGEVLDGRLAYGLEVSSGDGQNRPQIDSNADFVGRVFTRPFLGGGGVLDKLQLGVSGRVGYRDPAFVGYDHAPIATPQGYALWTPGYRDSIGRVIHIIPSGDQRAVGGELRFPVSMFDLRAEAYFVANNTREAVDGYQLTNTERLGAMEGVGWYAQLSAWPVGDRFITGDPGFQRPIPLELNKELERPRRGLELMVKVGGVNAEYQGASRGGALDAKTPSRQTGSRIDVFEYGFGASFWYTRSVRLSLNYILYHTPGSGTSANLAAVPANLIKDPVTGEVNAGEHLLHELSARAALSF